MTKEISERVNRGFENHEEVLSRPKSINILKKILLIRATHKERIRVEGLIDRYFFAAASAPETKGNKMSTGLFFMSYEERAKTVLKSKAAKIIQNMLKCLRLDPVKGPETQTAKDLCKDVTDAVQDADAVKANSLFSLSAAGKKPIRCSVSERASNSHHGEVLG